MVPNKTAEYQKTLMSINLSQNLSFKEMRSFQFENSSLYQSNRSVRTSKLFTNGQGQTNRIKFLMGLNISEIFQISSILRNNISSTTHCIDLYLYILVQNFWKRENKPDKSASGDEPPKNDTSSLFWCFASSLRCCKGDEFGIFQKIKKLTWWAF